MWDYIKTNPTKVLGYVVSVLGVLQSSTGVVPPSFLPYITTLIGILVVLAGQGNTQKIADAVVEKHLDIMATQANAITDARVKE